MLEQFKVKYKPTAVFCNENDKNELIKKLGNDYIVQVSENWRAKTDNEKFYIVYIPKMTKEDRKAFKTLQGANPATARKLMTWEMLNVRNKQMLKDIAATKNQDKKKKINFSGGYQLELYDMTDRDDFVWLIHTEPSDAANLKLVNEHLRQGILWDKIPFISCSLQDGFTGSYAGNQSIVHGAKAFPISFLLEVDPHAIIDTQTGDAKTPEGPQKTHHLKYVQPSLSQRLAQDQLQDKVVPKGSVPELQVQTEGLSSQEQLLRHTFGYNEVTVVTGELAKDWGVQPLVIRGIVIENNQLKRYLEQQDMFIPEYRQKNLDCLAEVIKLAKDHHLPVILIEPKVDLKQSLLREVKSTNSIYKPTDDDDFDVPGNYLINEIAHFLKIFNEKINDLNKDDPKKAWFEHMVEFLKKINLSGWNPELPKMNSVEEQVLLKIIIAEAKLDSNIERHQDIEAKLKENKSDEKKLNRLMLSAKRLDEDRQKIESDLHKSKKELSKHQPNLNLDIHGLSTSNKPK